MLKPFHIKKSIDNQFYFTIVGRNGKVLAMSETMKQKQSIKKSIAAIARIIMDNIESLTLDPNAVNNFDFDRLIQDETLKKNGNTNKNIGRAYLQKAIE